MIWSSLVGLAQRIRHHNRETDRSWLVAAAVTSIGVQEPFFKRPSDGSTRARAWERGEKEPMVEDVSGEDEILLGTPQHGHLRCIAETDVERRNSEQNTTAENKRRNRFVIGDSLSGHNSAGTDLTSHPVCHVPAEKLIRA